jgi:8-oxo-dGTP pyrophosphatase MutT (NUDIX family)
LLHRKRGEWFYPGGHCDGDWNWFGAALRECREEMGSTQLSVAMVEGDLWLPRLPGTAAALEDGFGGFVLPRVLVLHNAVDHQHIDCVYAFVTRDDGFHVALDEATEARWFGLSKVLDGSHGEGRLSGVTARVIGAVAATMGSSSSVEV